MYEYFDYCKTTKALPAIEVPVSGIVIYYSEPLEKAVAVQELVICKWSPKFGNKRRWMKCKPNGAVILDATPLDVLFWRSLKEKKTVPPPSILDLQREYKWIYPERRVQTLEYGTLETLAALGLNHPKQPYGTTAAGLIFGGKMI